MAFWVKGCAVLLFRKGKRWNGLVVGLFGAIAIMGCVNSVLQLSRYGMEIEERFSAGDQTMMAIWLALLVLWSLVLGLALGVFAGRQLYGTSAHSGSVTSSD
ncbi:hypothetical protein JYT24_00230 [Parvibaculum lavamentivorans]|nr:hypothetical protein [Parvibaculum lavamentivorans]